MFHSSVLVRSDLTIRPAKSHWSIFCTTEIQKCWKSWNLFFFLFPSYFGTVLDGADNMEALWTVHAVSSRRGSAFFRLLICVGLAHCCVQWCAGERNINAGDAGRTNKLVIKAAFVAGLSLNTPEASVQERRRTKLNSILENLFRPAPSIMHWHSYRASPASSLQGATQKHRFVLCRSQHQTSSCSNGSSPSHLGGSRSRKHTALRRSNNPTCPAPWVLCGAA